MSPARRFPALLLHRAAATDIIKTAAPMVATLSIPAAVLATSAERAVPSVRAP